MVRLHWHVDDGLGAFVRQNGMLINPENGVTHATTEIELAGQSITLEACFSLPPNYLRDSSTRDVGVVLAHGTQANTWKGKTMTHLATSLAAAGYLTVRYYCAGKEQRRLRVFEKTLEAAATSPFARGVSRWVICGLGSGGRVAANVGSKSKVTNIAAYAFLGYPLMEPHNVFKGPTAPDSINHLLKINAPILFVQPDRDELGSAQGILNVLDRMPSWDVRMVEMQGVDGAFRSPDIPHPLPETRVQLTNTMLEFLACLQEFRLTTCTSLPRIKSFPTPPQFMEAEKIWQSTQETRSRVLRRQLQQEVQMQMDKDRRLGTQGSLPRSSSAVASEPRQVQQSQPQQPQPQQQQQQQQAGSAPAAGSSGAAPTPNVKAEPSAAAPPPQPSADNNVAQAAPSQVKEEAGVSHSGQPREGAEEEQSKRQRMQ